MCCKVECLGCWKAALASGLTQPYIILSDATMSGKNKNVGVPLSIHSAVSYPRHQEVSGIQLQRLCYAGNVVKPCLCVKYLVNNRRSSTDGHTSHGHHVVPEEPAACEHRHSEKQWQQYCSPSAKTKMAFAGGRDQFDILSCSS